MTYRLQDCARLGRIGLAVGTLVVTSVVVHADTQALVPAGQAEILTLDDWADSVWTAGLDGDSLRMKDLIAVPPAPLADTKQAEGYRDRLGQWQRTQAHAAAELSEARSEALASLRESYEQGNLTESLKHAVAYQELLQEFDLALEHKDVRMAVNKAAAQVEDLIESGDLMQAQEILFMLKTAYEDTDRLAEFQVYDNRHEEIATQLQLLRRYEPERFYEMYRERAVARGDDAADIRAFNPALADRWRQEVGGVRVDILRSVLDTAAREHINSQGWEPLMSGGIDALQSLAVTPMIDETFPGLSDPAATQAWSSGLEMIDREMKIAFDSLGKKSSVSRHVGREVIDRISELNAQTVKLPDSVIWREFGDGAMEELDRFTEVIWPYDIEDFNRQMQGEFIGIGVYIEETELGEIRIVSPLEGKPANLAGIQSGDVVLDVDGETTSGWSLRDAVREITGPQGTDVTLGIQRQNEESRLEFKIVRDRIRMHTVKGWDLRGLDEEGNPDWNWFIDSDERIGYIRMTGFDQQTYGDLLGAISAMRSERGMPSGLILDLRHNPGGLLETAVNVSNLFVDEGRIVSGEDRFGEASFYATARKRKAYLAGTPVVVLINNGSASASEIVAGCLQAHDAAIVVGARSFGKGSVQTVHPITDNAKLKLTTQYYRLPSADGVTAGRMVHKVQGKSDWGVEPDLIVGMTPEQIVESIKIQRWAELQQAPSDWNEEESGAWTAPEIDTLLEDGLDPQLHTALILLQARAYGDHATMADSR
ncbi:MAG: S41 family peptidase [Phycisphaerales bacterium]|nr:S41 family peptidase [Phycisphaerales bacterium]